MSDSPVNVRVEGLDKALRKLRRLGPDAYRPAMAEGGAHLKNVMAQYPPRRYGPQPAKTSKQRAFLFWAIANGIIQVPYVRGSSPGSQTLGKRWTVAERDNGLTAVVGNNAGYARLVHSATEQTEYHRLTGWKTDQQVVEEEAPRVKEILTRHIQQAIRRD